jgi:hypothetical protein
LAPDGLGTFRVHPIPETAARTTTLVGAHTASVTTLTVASTTNFKTQGTVIVGSEVIRYRNISATQFLVCTRAAEGTTAASYVGGETVTERNIRIRYYTYPATLVSGTDVSQIPDQWIESVKLWVSAHALFKDERYDQGKTYMNLYRERMAAITRAARRRVPDKVKYVKDIGRSRFRPRFGLQDPLARLG